MATEHDRQLAVITGAFKNKAQVAASRLLPDSVKAEKHREMAESGSAKED